MRDYLRTHILRERTPSTRSQFMPATATATNGTQEKLSHQIEETDIGDKPARRGNPLMRSLYPSMIENPHNLDFADAMRSDEFAWEKTCKTILEPLSITTEKNWLDYCKQVWKWHLQAQQRENEALADKLLAEAASNPDVMEILKQKLASDQPKAA